jgi:hypothetical protein
VVDDYVAPRFGLDAFNCPHCGAYAHQQWQMMVRSVESELGGLTLELQDVSASFCKRCEEFSLWLDDRLFYPQTYVAPKPSSDMPEDVKHDYKEARSIYSQSPRGSAALLRLAIQKLVIDLGESGDNLNGSIGNLVKKGLPKLIQKSLDTVRVIGNNAVHPGQIDIEDNPEIALSLFKLVNLIVQHMISLPKEVDELYSSLPEEAKDAIAERDKETEAGMKS